MHARFLNAVAAASLVAGALAAQAQPDQGPMRQATQLDLDGRTAEARALFQAMIDSALPGEAKARAQRQMAMSYAFDGDCQNTARYETLVIAHWATREQADPQNAFYQQGEMANEAARVCLEAGDFAAAERWYRQGYALGLKEPAPATHPRSLWEFRLAHALARIAARRGDTTTARQQIELARRALDGDSAMAAGQERFYPYLVGYVALHTNDLTTAAAQLAKAIALKGNDRDPFMHCLLAMTYERQGRQADAREMYQRAYDLATSHNPNAAFVRPFARKKLNLTGSP